MTITEQIKRPNIRRSALQKYSTKKDKYNNEYLLDGQTLYVKFFYHNSWFVIKDIDYRINKFYKQINQEIFFKFGVSNDVKQIFEKEGII